MVPPVKHRSGLGFLKEMEAKARSEAFTVAETSALIDSALQPAGSESSGDELVREVRRMKTRAFRFGG